MIDLLRTGADDRNFKELVLLLDLDLQLSDGEEHTFFAQFNGTENIKYAIVAFDGEKAVGCGALREHEEGTAEIKRMFVRDEHRGKGIGSQVLESLEAWAMEMSYLRCILETGRNRPDAVKFYNKNGYREIDNFGPYKGVEGSICFEKVFVTG